MRTPTSPSEDRPDAGHSTTQHRFLDEFGRLRERRDGDRMFKFDMQHYFEALLTSEDRLSMAFSVDSRVPLLDHRIAELAGRLGFEQKATLGRSKDLLRRAVDGIFRRRSLRDATSVAFRHRSARGSATDAFG